MRQIQRREAQALKAVVNTVEGVLDCSVVGVPHEQLGEVPALFVVPRSGHTIDADILPAHCRASLSVYKLPRVEHMITEIPRTGSGKIIRYKLRERVEV